MTSELIQEMRKTDILATEEEMVDMMESDIEAARAEWDLEQDLNRRYGNLGSLIMGRLDDEYGRQG